jgi:hypothetical protein
MRRVILKDRECEINFEDLTDKSFVGIQWEDGKKCMIVDTREGYCSISNDQHYPNTWNVWYSPTVKEYVKNALNQGNNTKSQAFVFNDVKELFKWMSH